MKKPTGLLNKEQIKVYNAIDRVQLAVEPVIREMPEAKMWLSQFEQIIYSAVRGYSQFHEGHKVRDYIGNGEFPELAMLGVDPDYVKRCLNETGVAALRCR